MQFKNTPAQASALSSLVLAAVSSNLPATTGPVKLSSPTEEAKALLLKLEEVSAVNPHVAFTLLRQCAGFCKLAHLARGTPPSQAISALEAFDHDIRATFSKCTAHSHLLCFLGILCTVLTHCHRFFPILSFSCPFPGIVIVNTCDVRQSY